MASLGNRRWQQLFARRYKGNDDTPIALIEKVTAGRARLMVEYRAAVVEDATMTMFTSAEFRESVGSERVAIPHTHKYRHFLLCRDSPRAIVGVQLENDPHGGDVEAPFDDEAARYRVHLVDESSQVIDRPTLVRHLPESFVRCEVCTADFKLTHIEKLNKAADDFRRGVKARDIKMCVGCVDSSRGELFEIPYHLLEMALDNPLDDDAPRKRKRGAH
tara:strand:+ start:2764 stop:3417 length:654 start_codon:yes stop_codon:yes gene_type:complete